MQEYNLELLQDDLQLFKSRIASFNACYSSIYNTLFKYGFRISEVTDQSRWDISNLPFIIINTEKKSNNRIINISDLDDYAKTALNAGFFPYTNTSAKVASYFMKNYYNRKAMYVENKLVTTHLFRHYAIKFWYEIGWSVTQISEFIGEVDEKNTIGYINSKLYYID